MHVYFISVFSTDFGAADLYQRLPAGDGLTGVDKDTD